MASRNSSLDWLHGSLSQRQNVKNLFSDERHVPKFVSFSIQSPSLQSSSWIKHEEHSHQGLPLWNLCQTLRSQRAKSLETSRNNDSDAKDSRKALMHCKLWWCKLAFSENWITRTTLETGAARSVFVLNAAYCACVELQSFLSNVLAALFLLQNEKSGTKKGNQIVLCGEVPFLIAETEERIYFPRSNLKYLSASLRNSIPKKKYLTICLMDCNGR